MMIYVQIMMYEVYCGSNKEPRIFYVPVGKKGTTWYVFEIKNNKISKIDNLMMIYVQIMMYEVFRFMNKFQLD